MLITAVDIGNTRAHAADFEIVRGRPRLKRFTALSHTQAMSPATWKPGVVVYASVKSNIDVKFAQAVREATGHPPLRMGTDFVPAIRTRYRHAGADRLANAAAAWARARRACLVVDLGTAITLDVVDARGEFVGGLIAPGLCLQARALHEHTSLLPEVAPARARRAIGRSTREAIAAGVSLSVEGLIRTALADARRELGGRPRVIGTGGDAPLYRDLFDEVVPHLTLEGIAVSYAKAL